MVVDGLTVTRQSTDQTLRFDKVVVESRPRAAVGCSKAR